jgi:intracellular septation protein
MQLMTLVLVIVMGGLSVWLNDERFIKMKPTLLYLAFGGDSGGASCRANPIFRP